MTIKTKESIGVKDPTSSQEQKKEVKKLWDPLIDGVKWIEKYSDPLEKFFYRLPDFLGTVIATFALFTFGATLRGEWVVILVSALKQITGNTQTSKNMTTESVFDLINTSDMKLENFGIIFVLSHIVSYATYFLMGGFLHWYFYINKRDKAEEWKLQPKRWITPELERDEIYNGVIALFICGSFSAFLATYILNENPTKVYFTFDEYGWLWFFLQFPIHFIYQDYTTYILHRLYHTPFLYKHFHKLHHKYKTPTAFSVTAIHPFEISHIQLTLYLPIFLFPFHWLPFYTVIFYSYYHGIIDHSGINFKAEWWQPWQPDAEFHDKHHEFFHCNYGFNMTLWDKLHGTSRKENRLYTENTYNGEAPLIDSEEAKRLAEIDEDARENLQTIKNLLEDSKKAK